MYKRQLSAQVGQLGTLQGQQLESFAQQLARLTLSNEQRFEQLRLAVETRLGAIQADNASKLEEMRKTVDEKLHATLEQRLGDSFKLVSERLEQVHKGLGEMQSLAAGVGDLKKVLTDVYKRQVPASTNKESPTAPAPLEWSLGEAKLTGGSLRWLDESNKKPFKASIDVVSYTHLDAYKRQALR